MCGPNINEKIPVIGYVQNGGRIVCSSKPCKETMERERTVKEVGCQPLLRQNEEYRAFKVFGKCMLPLFKQDDILITLKDDDQEIQDRDKVIFQDPKGRYWVKLIQFYEDEVFLNPINPAYKTRVMKRDVVKMERVHCVLFK